MTKSRIEFIDLAKGICIILVVTGHCGVPINIPGLEIVRMPLYFILSGLFYKNYGGLEYLLEKKINKILIPFFFFYILGYIAFYGIKIIAPSYLITEAKGITDLFTNRQYFNGPIWFLLALFWCNIYYCIIESIVSISKLNCYLSTSIAVITVGLIGWYLGNHDIFTPLFLDVGMTSLPFFYCGIILKRTSLLYPNRMDKYNIIFLLIAYSSSVFISKFLFFRLSLHYNAIEGLGTYLLSLTSVFAVLMLCKMIKHIPVVSYLGRYSVIVLGLHHLYYRPLKVLLGITNYDILNNSYTLAIITLLLCLISIPVSIRLIPWFVAQKDLIKWKQEKKYSYQHTPVSQD